MAKNLHITHIEDDFILSGPNGSERIIRVLLDLIDMLETGKPSSTKLTQKWDGAPSIVFGQDPETKKFFVGTKSVFNKNTPKINYTQEDIQKNHPQKGLQYVLSLALRFLEETNPKSVYQGDMLFVGGELSTKTIDSTPMIVFKPNTITYAVPKSTPMATNMMNAQIGIVIHTEYTGDDIRSMSASYNPDVSKLKKTKNVWLDDAEFKNVTSSVAFKDSKRLRKEIESIEKTLKSYAAILKILERSPKLAAKLMKYINSEIRQGSSEISADRFLVWYESKMKEKDRPVFDKLKKLEVTLNKLFGVHSQIASIKNDIINHLEKLQTNKFFVQDKSGFRVTKSEGFVAIDSETSGVVKLVDRLEFSRLNFELSKMR